MLSVLRAAMTLAAIADGMITARVSTCRYLKKKTTSVRNFQRHAAHAKHMPLRIFVRMSVRSSVHMSVHIAVHTDNYKDMLSVAVCSLVQSRPV